ncbi:hypothetical protein [Mesomycoplasma molare]|uniref:NERD domain-containing protein n=1 Tax=Mesomycoplasma molare TaxID=171288 RepID=A0ABY5TYA1_9BACT|nr:hypothetical protein [Mesomycoplasma molare]UWD34014.1 hypothetical protein NX772_02810 [Mesomycoplasma molare]
MLNIAVIVLGSILGLILLGVILFRIYEKIKGKSIDFKQNKIGHINKITIEKLKIFNSFNDSLVLTNILVKNNLAKNGFSLFCGVVITKEKIYVLSDLILSTKKEKVEINDEGCFFVKDNKKTKKELWETRWLKEQTRWLEKKTDQPIEVLILIDETIDKQNIINHTDYRVTNIYELNDEIKLEREINYNPKNIANIFLRNNKFKGKIND